MSFRTYLLLMCLSTLLAWLGWAYVVNNVGPLNSGGIGPILFYVTLLVSLIGSLTLLGLFVRLAVLRRSAIQFREVRISFRHAMELSAVAVIALFLSSQEWLVWWSWLLLLAGASLIEGFWFFLQSNRRS